MGYSRYVFRRIFWFARHRNFHLTSKLSRKVPAPMGITNQSSSLHGVTITNINEAVETTSFRDMLSRRLQQAHRSIIVEVLSQDNVNEVSEIINDSGDVEKILRFTSKSKKEFIIVEFKGVSALQNFLSRCKSVSQIGQIPNFSRLLKFDSTSPSEGSLRGLSNIEDREVNVGVLQNFDVKDRYFNNVTEVLENVYEEEKLTDIGFRLRFFVCSQMSEVFHGLFRHCEVLPFGSSVNGLGTHSSDLDSVLIFCQKKDPENSVLFFQPKEALDPDYEQKIVKTVAHVLNTFVVGVIHVEPIFRARVPLVKFYHKPFELKCDLSTSNVSGLQMSEMLYNCGLMDSRVKPLAYAIRKWGKMAKITSDVGTHTISNFALFLLLTHFLQTRPSPILPPLAQVAEIEKNFAFASNNFRRSTSNQETLGDLLGEFFCLLKEFDFKKNGISPYEGKIIKKRDNIPLFIENPLDTEQNVSLNVTKNSLKHLREAAALGQNHLEILSRNTKISKLHFWKTLSS